MCGYVRRFSHLLKQNKSGGTSVSESQSSDYESGLAQIEGFEWHVRTARNTPSKPGAFVAFWRRDIEGQFQPFSDDSMNSGLLVFVRNHAQRGVFRFSADHLAELGITAVGSQPGKRGFRVYLNQSGATWL
ncbi:MepB family protein [Corynebacterium pseudodiphtheriticum]|uniref:MepB family protein n=1 Tax=Corynebacterium pseudodiphtheriticum TaxID=37637 RepID=UPI000F8939D4|nr:metallopeptidase [Corynebacterium pseudodiphtheriticum]RUP94802.1 metallopeptidase [Corynebacterium pseudodiphtheriticum]RUP98973.1 metallopeptidase [Corynebacterium pseudodiphtheriticum]RUQ47462.1 metallopeptidase [Corynebacterium pseudodiphtheriticum]